VTAIQTVLNAVAATATAKTNWKDAKLAEEAIIAQDGPTVRGIRENLATLFVNNTTALADLMITPRKPYKPLSAAARAAANAKAKATRQARGTKGSVQKAAITGDVTGVVITPVVAGSSSTPSGSSTPAPAANSVPVASAPVASPASGASTPAATPAAQPVVSTTPQKS